MRALAFVLMFAAALPRTAAAQPSLASGASAEAYYQFLVGRQLEDEGDIDGAIAAYQKAADLDPTSSEARAELAALYARSDRAEEALATADAALRVNPRNTEAHRVIGAIHAVIADSAAPGDADPTSRAAAASEHVRTAITHLEQALTGHSTDLSTHLTLARLYLRTRAFDKAMASLRRVLDEEPGMPDAVLMLARAYAGAGRRADAIQALEEATAGQPRFFRGLIVLAELYEADHRWRDAADTYERAAAQNPHSADLKTRRATALMNGGDVKAARDYLREVAEAHPSDASALYLLAEAERETGGLAAAEAAARRLIALDAADLRGPYALARVLERRHDYRGLAATLEPILAPLRGQQGSARQRVLLLVSLALAYQELGQYDRAIATFDDARALSPADVTLDAYAAQAQLRAKRYAEALTLLRAARARAPRDFQLARLEAEALERRGDAARAVAVLEDARRDHADDPAAHIAMADLYEKTGRFEDGLRVLKDATDRFPADPAIPFELGALYERRQRYDEAERAFRAALAKDDRHAPALNYLGYMLAERGQRLEESIDLIRRALAIDPENGAYLDSLGWAYFKSNQLNEAEPHLQRAAAQLVTNSVVQDHLGELFFKLGRFDQAIAAWERALAGDGESIERGAIEKKIRAARARHDRK